MSEVATTTTTDETGTGVIDPRAMIDNLRTGAVGVYSTIPTNTFAERVSVLAALTNTVPLNEHLGEPFGLTNFIAQAVEINDGGTLIPSARVILVTDDGTSYHCVATGVMRALENIVGLAGHPSEWDEPIQVVAVEERTRAGYRVTTLNVLDSKAPAAK